MITEIQANRNHFPLFSTSLPPSLWSSCYYHLSLFHPGSANTSSNTMVPTNTYTSTQEDFGHTCLLLCIYLYIDEIHFPTTWSQLDHAPWRTKQWFFQANRFPYNVDIYMHIRYFGVKSKDNRISSFFDSIGFNLSMLWQPTSNS